MKRMKAMHTDSDPVAAHAQNRLISEITDFTSINSAERTGSLYRAERRKGRPSDANC